MDTNILVYAARMDLPQFEIASRRLADLNRGGVPWALPWHCIHEFFGVVTNRKLWREPTPPLRAIHQINLWLESPLVVPIAEGGGYRTALSQVLRESGITGPAVHDARVVAVCREHGIDTIWSADRDLRQFTGIKIVNPLL